MPPERIARLEAFLGWVWNANAFRIEQAFVALERFTAREGHARPPAKHIEDGFKLGQWVSAQRRSKDRLPPERIARFEAFPGWVWDAR